MKKTKRTPEQQVKRGKRALAILTAMAAVCLLAFAARKCEEPEAMDHVTLAMDEMLDSLMNEEIFIVTRITDKEDYRTCRITPPCPEEDSLHVLKLKIQFSETDEETARQANRRITDLEEHIKRYYDDKTNELVYYNRRIRFETEGGHEYTCIQTIDTTLLESRLKHIICLDNIEIDMSMIKEIENTH